MRGPCRESVGELDRERDRAPVAAPARGERDRERAPARGEHDRKREERHRAETGNTTSSGEHDRNAPVRASGDPNTSGDVMKATERHTLEENGNYILWWGSTLYLFMKCTLDEKYDNDNKIDEDDEEYEDESGDEDESEDEQ